MDMEVADAGSRGGRVAEGVAEETRCRRKKIIWLQSNRAEVTLGSRHACEASGAVASQQIRAP